MTIQQLWDLILKITAVVADFGGIFGLFISILSYLKIRSVQRAQREERRFVRSLYNTDTIRQQLRAAAVALQQSQDLRAHELAEELVTTVGQIEGITRALESMESPSQGTAGVQIGFGYFTPEFIKHQIQQAMNTLDFLVYRNWQLSNVDIVEDLHEAAKRGVCIRLLAISPAACDIVLDEACKVLPRPRAGNAADLREQLLGSEKMISTYIKGHWNEEERTKLQYRGYVIAPNMHFVRRDMVLTVGFIGTLATAQPNMYSKRPYIEVPLRSEVGQELIVHFDELWKLSSSRLT